MPEGRMPVEHAPYDLALATRMAEVAEFYSLDILHVHYAIPHSVCALLARQMLAARGGHLPMEEAAELVGGLDDLRRNRI